MTPLTPQATLCGMREYQIILTAIMHTIGWAFITGICWASASTWRAHKFTAATALCSAPAIIMFLRAAFGQTTGIFRETGIAIAAVLIVLSLRYQDYR
ncbi:MAG: hypothetical protein IPO08_20985 [Xanthomonadales bacterium]|nr:hypothetical protein [Xanthomonadales bacterium]